MSEVGKTNRMLEATAEAAASALNLGVSSLM
jgi:hypothetical protein